MIDRKPLAIACLLWLALVAAYHLDDSLVEEGDAVANVELPLALLQTGSLAFSPRYSPILFFWKSAPPLVVRDDYYVRNWFERHAGRAAGVWHATGELKLNGPRYFVIKSPRSDRYLSTFSVVPGLTFLPMIGALRALDADLPYKTALRLSAARLYAASLVSLSAVFLFLIARRYASGAVALGLALAYALGTSVWSIASETLWQQTVSLALLMGAALAYMRARERSSLAAVVLTGVLLGTATASRPTAIFYLMAIALHMVVEATFGAGRRERLDALARLGAGALLPLLAIAAYNLHYFGTPFNFAQELVGHQVALEKTGDTRLWQTPLVIGVTGLMLSPSRGLLVFSPFLVLGLVGLRSVLSDLRYVALRPLAIAALMSMAVQAKWFDWWGGWAYGPRPWVEAVPILVLCMLPTLDSLRTQRWAQVLLGMALAWSVFVQGLGAFAYDKYWNGRDLHAVLGSTGRTRFYFTESEARHAAQLEGGQYTGEQQCNIDRRECRYRLWSLDDNIISFYLDRWPVSREHRMHLAWHDFAPFQ